MTPDPATLTSNATAFPPLGLLVVALLLLAGWARAQVWSRQARGLAAGAAFIGRSGLGFLTLLAAAGAAESVIVFSTHWPLWPILLLAALLIEGLMAIARLERNIVSRRSGRALTLLRITAVLAVVLMLGQPVFITDVSRTVHRHLAVLLDQSASMQIQDPTLTGAERIRLAEALHGAVPARPVALESVTRSLTGAGEILQSQADWLNTLAATPPDLRPAQLAPKAQELRTTLKQVQASLTEAVRQINRAASAPFLQDHTNATPASLQGILAELETQAAAPLAQALTRAADIGAASDNGITAYDTLRQTLLTAGAFLTDLGRLRQLGDAVDEAYYRSLSTGQRDLVNAETSQPRADLMTRLILAQIQPLGARYGLRFYTFGSTVTEIKRSALKQSIEPRSSPRLAGKQDQGTDFCGALEKVATESPPEEMAGILLCSDGRHNAPGNPETLASRFGRQGVPIFPVMAGGGMTPPTDAAIVDVTAPESISTNERALFNVDLKLDGLTDRDIKVMLFNGTRPVATNLVKPTGPAFRSLIQLADSPTANGVQDYRIQVDRYPDEVNTSNNVYSIPVRVSSDTLKILLIDGVPRWEFRYLKNLFLQRDQNVRLQYLLLHPDQIAGFTNRPPKAASASDNSGEAEATRFPVNTVEWLKFDAIILGDVAPGELGPETMETLRHYVLDRGGTLIVIAGNRHMPQAYTDTPLADLLPVTFSPATRALLTAPEGEFRLALTTEGRHTEFMKLDDDPTANLAAWNTLPELHWRNSSIRPKGGAAVLAYAVPPSLMPRDPGASIPDAETLTRLQQLERDQALIISHHAGLGSVLMFGFDQTWRMRYKRGDLYHHKLWGQILRWATGERMTAGTDTARLGTSRARYPQGIPVRVTARLTTPDFIPIVNATPSLILRSHGKPVLRRPMAYRKDSAGLYTAEIKALAAGHYTVELEPAAIWQADPGTPIATDFAVTDDTSRELAELTADRGLPGTLARLSGGTVLDPSDLDALPARLGPGTITQTERRQVDLWDSWFWLIFILALLSAEWMLRKQVRLP